MKRTTILIAFCFMALCSLGQISFLECKSLKFGDFILDNPQDSIYVYRDLASWYEMNMTKGFRNIFTIIWRDDCNFLLVYKACSAKDDSLKVYVKNDTLSYSAVSHTATGITFNVTSKSRQYKQTLTMQPDLDVWEIMLSRDAELLEDSLLSNGLAALFPDSVNRSLSLLKQQIKEATFNRQEVEQIEQVLLLLKRNDIGKINSFTSDDFNELVSQAVLTDYNEYLKSTYGKLMNYSVRSRLATMDFDSLLAGITFNDVNEYILDAVFEKTKGNVQITTGLKKDTAYKIQFLNVQPDSNTTVPFIAKLTKNFWTQLKAKDFQNMYDNSSRLFKRKATYELLKNILSLIQIYGRLSYYKLSEQNFVIDGGRGFIATGYVLDKDNKKAVINLRYVYENGSYKLAGLNYTQK